MTDQPAVFDLENHVLHLSWLKNIDCWHPDSLLVSSQALKKKQPLWCEEAFQLPNVCKLLGRKCPKKKVVVASMIHPTWTRTQHVALKNTRMSQKSWKCDRSRGGHGFIFRDNVIEDINRHSRWGRNILIYYTRLFPNQCAASRAGNWWQSVHENVLFYGRLLSAVW